MIKEPVTVGADMSLGQFMGTFALRLEDNQPRAEPLYGVGVLMVDGVRRYLERVRPDALTAFTEGLDRLEHDFVELARVHSEMIDSPPASEGTS